MVFVHKYTRLDSMHFIQLNMFCLKLMLQLQAVLELGVFFNHTLTHHRDMVNWNQSVPDV